MPQIASSRDPHIVLQDLLVQEFRTLQSLIALTREEHTQLTKKDSRTLMVTVEQKESILDHFGMLEESRRMVIEEIAHSLGIPLKNSSLSELLPYLDEMLAGSLSRLGDGIIMLANEARDLNQGNKALAAVSLEWVGAAQAFLFNLFQPDPGYRPRGQVPAFEQMPASDIDHRI